MHWEGFAAEQPRLAALGHRRLGNPGVVLVATIRSDGTPRVSPVEPLFWKLDLWLSMLEGSHKAADLDRNPRVLVHSIVASRDGALGEYKVRGRVVAETDPWVHEGFAEAVGRTSAGNPSRESFTCSGWTWPM